METKIELEYENSWQKMMRKYLLASVSEKNPIPLTSGPLSDSNPSGITTIAKKLLDHQSSSILTVADEIWLCILEIQKLMKLRNTIDEKKMESEEEANNLLKTTNTVQKLIEHVSEQEEKYIQLSDSVNNNTVHIVQSYIRLSKQGMDIIKKIVDQVSSKLSLGLKEQNKGVESSIMNATSIYELKDFSSDNTLSQHSSMDPIVWANQIFKHQNYDDFILIQALVLIAYRYAMSQAVSEQRQNLDIKKVTKELQMAKEQATELMNEHDLEQTFNLENFSQQKSTSEELKLSLEINPDFLQKIEKTLTELKGLSDSRESKDDNQNTKMKTN